MPTEVAFTRAQRGSEQPRAFHSEIADLAKRQHGVVGRRQLREMGLGEDAIDWRLRVGLLHRLRPGVYAIGHTALSQRGESMAAVLACGPGAVLSHRSAALLWGIGGYRGAAIDVTTPGKRRSGGGLRRHSSSLPTDEITAVAGIPVTTVPRTLFDLAAVAPNFVESALRRAEYLRLHDPLSLRDLLARYPSRRGARAIQRCLDRLADDPDGRTRSPLEDRFLPFLDRHELPRPRLNVWIEVGGKLYEADCLWPKLRQVVELDGWGGHGTRTAFHSDRARDRRLRVGGYEVTRITWGQLEKEPDAIAADLRRLLVVRDNVRT